MVVTEELAHRVERAAVRWSRAWMGGVPGVRLAAGLPDHVLAPCHPDRPELDFQNRVNGLTPDDVTLVPDLLEWYAGLGVRPWFELVPTDRSADLLAALDSRAIGFHAVALARPSRTSVRPPAHKGAIEVVDPTDDEAFATFARTRTAAHELPAEVAEQAAADLGGWRTAPGATLYLARDGDGEPVATAALTVDPADGIGYLADGATVPAARGRGLQSELIRRRLDDAARAGCEVACSQASFGSTSHRNLQREGLVHGFTKLVLRRGTNDHPRH